MLRGWSVRYMYSTQDDRKSTRDVASVVYRVLESSARARERTQKAALLKLEKIEKSVHLIVLHTQKRIGFNASAQRGKKKRLDSQTKAPLAILPFCPLIH